MLGVCHVQGRGSRILGERLVDLSAIPVHGAAPPRERRHEQLALGRSRGRSRRARCPSRRSSANASPITCSTCSSRREGSSSARRLRGRSRSGRRRGASGRGALSSRAISRRVAGRASPPASADAESPLRLEPARRREVERVCSSGSERPTLARELPHERMDGVARLARLHAHEQSALDECGRARPRGGRRSTARQSARVKRSKTAVQRSNSTTSASSSANTSSARYEKTGPSGRRAASIAAALCSGSARRSASISEPQRCRPAARDRDGGLGEAARRPGRATPRGARRPPRS